jgi:Tfp pilus assembly protein PilV
MSNLNNQPSMQDPMKPIKALFIAVTIGVLIMGLAVVNHLNQPTPEQVQQAQVQQRAEAQYEQTRAAAQAEWERKNCIMFSGQYVCTDKYNQFSPWSDFKAARPDLIK